MPGDRRRTRPAGRRPQRAWAALRPRAGGGRGRRARGGRGRRLPGPRRGRAAPTSTNRSRCSTADGPTSTRCSSAALRIALAAAAERPAELRRLDRRREIDPGWFQRTRMQGYVCYVDRFCGTLAELPGRLDYLAELGTTYLHLMPLLQPRPGENDGGYAVMDYRAVDPRLGTMDDLEDVAGALHERGMSLCIDLVLNHTAREHAWAQGWLAGDPEYAGFYTAFPDRTMPDAYDATIPEVFPDRAPGLVHLGARGLRRRRRLGLDDVLAVPVGPRLHEPRGHAGDARRDHLAGQPRRRRLPDGRRPVHVEAAGHHLPEPAGGPPAAAAAARADPAGRARASSSRPRRSSSPEDLVPYLGGHERYRPECELAYHNQLMVLLWSSLATQDARLAAARAGPHAADPADDVVGDLRARARRHRLGGQRHRRRGRRGQRLRPPALPQRLLLGPLPGVVRPRRAVPGERGDRGRADLRHRRPRCAASRTRWSAATTRRWSAASAGWCCSTRSSTAFGGIPLLYMGDELALRNDTGYLADPERAPDNRWMHRPPMDWAAAARRDRPGDARGPGVRLAAAARRGPARAAGAARRRRVHGPGRRQRRRPGLAPPAPAQRHLRRAGQLQPRRRRRSTPTR